MLDDGAREEYLYRSCLERLEDKANRIASLNASMCGDWPQTIYSLLFRYIVGERNRPAAEQLSRLVPYSIVMRECSTLRSVEALLIGASGLLELCGDDEYSSALRQEFEHLAVKYSIAPMASDAWACDYRSYYQHPLLHLVQVASLLHSGKITLDNILNCNSSQSLKEMFGACISEYWCNRLGDATAPLAPRLGAMRRNILGINFIAPLVYTYGRSIHRAGSVERSIALLRELPAEDNRYIRQWLQRGVIPRNALESQALLQLSLKH